MKKKSPEYVMNLVIVSAFVWLFADPEATYSVTKIHLIVACIFLIHKVLKNDRPQR